jgi:hypothetical protein
VKIDNVDAARPVTGLAAADVVYVEPVEGGLTRLVAMYASQHPPVVGPVRSARMTDVQLLGQFGRPGLAYSGAAAPLSALLANAPIVDDSQVRDPDAYFRDRDRAAPHNLYLRPARLPPAAAGSSSADWRTGPAPAGGSPVRQRQVRYPAASSAFRWSTGSHRWLVWMDLCGSNIRLCSWAAGFRARSDHAAMWYSLVSP